jgi:methylthioribulose-1-phosphate dehydratase
MTFEEIASELVELGRRACSRGWVLGTSGNFSAVVSVSPLRLAITPSGVDKGRLDAGKILEVDQEGRVLRGQGHPSAEMPLHLAIVRTRWAGAVAHTHSSWSTLLSDRHCAAGGIALEGYEMLKGLTGVETHEHREWLPIVENSQDWERDAPMVGEVLRGQLGAHGLLIRRHGLYTWGRDLGEAARHLETLEFLLEVTGRTVS